MRQISLWILIFSWIPQLIFVRFCQNHPEWVDQYYAQTIYPTVQHLRSIFFGYIPFSVGDCLYGVVGLTGIYLFFGRVKKMLRQPLIALLQGAALLAAIHLFFQLSWGLNYYRTALAETMQVPKSYDNWELESTTLKLLNQTNRLHQILAKNDSLAVVFPKHNAYYNRVLGNASSKISLWSLPLSYMGYGGYLNPFTGEAQINGQLPTLAFITTSAHEQAHQSGIAAENEANFLAFLKTYKHANPYIRYAGYSFALRYCWNALYRNHPDCATEIASKLRIGVRKDYQILQNFWLAHQNPLQPVINNIYDHFLKANGQQEGVHSYSQVVAFLIQHRYHF